METVFRVDSSTEIGSGHVSRCLTIANALKKRGHSIIFICRDFPGNINDKVIAEGHKLIKLPNIEISTDEIDSSVHHAKWLGVGWSVDAFETKSILKKMNCHLLVIDHYGIDFQWEMELEPFCKKILVIDDLADRRHHCDTLLDQNLVSNFENRYALKVPEKCQLCLGPDFVILQPDYFEVRSKEKSENLEQLKIFAFFGLADKENLIEKTVRCFLNLNRHNVFLDVVGSFKNSNYQSISDKYSGHKNINFFGQLPSLAPLIASANVVVGAGGTTSWERLYLGRKTIVITVAENQISSAKALHERGLIDWLGPAENVPQEVLTTALQKSLAPEWHIGWPEKGYNIVDGLGLDRLFQRLNAD